MQHPEDLGWLLAEECILQNEREFLNTLSSLIDQSTNLSGIIGFSHQCGLGQRCPQWTSSPKPCSLWPAAPARQVPDDAPHLPVDSCLQVALRVPAVTYKSFFSSPWVFMFCLLFGNLLLIQHIEQQWRTLPRIQVHGEPFSVSEFNSSAFNLIPCSSIWTKWIWAFKCFQQSLMSHFF